MPAIGERCSRSFTSPPPIGLCGRPALAETRILTRDRFDPAVGLSGASDDPGLSAEGSDRRCGTSRSVSVEALPKAPAQELRSELRRLQACAMRSGNPCQERGGGYATRRSSNRICSELNIADGLTLLLKSLHALSQLPSPRVCSHRDAWRRAGNGCAHARYLLSPGRWPYPYPYP